MGGEVGGVLAGLANLARIAQGRRRIGERLDQGVAPADDRRQDVVEVVGDAGGEVADRLRFLGPLQLPLELPAIGDVAGEHQLAANAGGVEEAGRRGLDRPPAAVAPPHPELDRRLGGGCARRRGVHCREPPLRGLTVVGMDELQRRQADALTRRIAERPLRRRRHRGDGVRRVEDRHDFGDLLDDALERRGIVDTPRRLRPARWIGSAASSHRWGALVPSTWAWKRTSDKGCGCVGEQNAHQRAAGEWPGSTGQRTASRPARGCEEPRNRSRKWLQRQWIPDVDASRAICRPMWTKSTLAEPASSSAVTRTAPGLGRPGRRTDTRRGSTGPLDARGRIESGGSGGGGVDGTRTRGLRRDRPAF